ncbi:polysaccharide pyruvyl transferase [Mobilisporobacter senegalensis]|uniref:Polysaccharide pyruvyl transferase n=1 Tax=Mobilisporobacter senegalensis TaxID=1329262 RepID=A0A3N1XXY3_9FIRM|nr:polysaccharide pyruvyl transferase family protein [Mobilisporobacter senegalensis]ROR31466.1 polysaccharide pyruvyl transferase [Mobilisporobacter senegalensis]
MKVGIITFHNYNNYGAILQSYALQKILYNLGCESEIIDYNCNYISKPYRYINLKQKGFFTYLFGVIGFICYLPRKKRCNEFRKLMNYSISVNNSNINSLSNAYDYYISGSDQVWNYKLTNFDKNYFLEFVNDNKKKLSYAASFGLSNIQNQYRQEYAKLLSKFNKILVREKQGANIVNDLIGQVPEVVLDPTLLLTQDDWINVSSDIKRKKEYILVYQLGFSKRLINFTKKLSRETSCEILFIPFPLGKSIKCRPLINIGPKEWLGLFKNAKYIVSDSFHGIIFSVLFNKNFFAEVSGQHKNSRAENFLSQFGLKDRIISNDYKVQLTQDIDYTVINERINIAREKSIESLKNMLI